MSTRSLSALVSTSVLLLLAACGKKEESPPPAAAQPAAPAPFLCHGTGRLGTNAPDFLVLVCVAHDRDQEGAAPVALLDVDRDAQVDVLVVDDARRVVTVDERGVHDGHGVVDRPHHGDHTAWVLDELGRLDVRATFFLQGRWVEAFPAVARSIVDGGHLMLSTPNLAAWYNRGLLLAGVQPVFSEVSLRGIHGRPGREVVGHLRLYTARALREFVAASGFDVVRLAGAPFHGVPRPLRALDRLACSVPGAASILLLHARKA